MHFEGGCMSVKTKIAPTNYSVVIYEDNIDEDSYSEYMTKLKLPLSRIITGRALLNRLYSSWKSKFNL